MDFQRAVQAYLWAIPLTGFAQWQEEHENVFGAKDGDLVYYVSFKDKLGLLTSSFCSGPRFLDSPIRCILLWEGSLKGGLDEQETANVFGGIQGQGGLGGSAWRQDDG